MKRSVINVRKLTILSLLLFVFVLSACASQPTPPTDNSFEGNTTPEATQENNQSNGQTGDGKTIVYANVEINIVSVDQQSSFPDDTNPSSGWLLRLVLKETNLTDSSVYLNYSDAWRLLLPDGTSLAPYMYQQGIYIEEGVVRDNWVDFELEGEQDSNQLVLRLGTTEEYQFDIPLHGNGDLSAYQTYTTTPGNTFAHGDTNWAITKVTSSYSYAGIQAIREHRYITIDFTVDNTSSDSFYTGIDSYARLKSSSVTQAPETYTLPVYIDANSQGTTGTITFLMPAGDADLTFQLLAHDGLSEVSSNFTI